MSQLGDLKRRLESPHARCVDCGAPPMVIDTCRLVYGELICCDCDIRRHSTSPCARTRHAILALPFNLTLGSNSTFTPTVLISLHFNDIIRRPADVPNNSRVIAAENWINKQGGS